MNFKAIFRTTLGEYCATNTAFMVHFQAIMSTHVLDKFREVKITSRDPFHEQSYTFVYKIVNKSRSRRTIVLHYKGNQSKITIVLGMYTTVHETGPRFIQKYDIPVLYCDLFAFQRYTVNMTQCSTRICYKNMSGLCI